MLFGGLHPSRRVSSGIAPARQTSLNPFDSDLPVVTEIATAPLPTIPTPLPPPPPPSSLSLQPIKVVPVVTSSDNDDDESSSNNDYKSWMKDGSLTVVILGATSELAKQKTYSALFQLWKEGLIPRDTQIFGVGHTPLRTPELRKRLKPALLERFHNEASALVFLNRCTYTYCQSYDDRTAFAELAHKLQASEDDKDRCIYHNRLFYFCLPSSSIVQQAAFCLKTTSCLQDDPTKGWSRLVLEKPFGHDVNSFEVLQSALSQNYPEHQLYRMDHYLGKEIVQNLTVLRFANRWLEKIWNRDHIQCVILTFKEKDGILGAGGGDDPHAATAYFDQHGIIRDVIQNHLLQVLSLIAMEAPTTLDGEDSIKAVHDAKLNVLNSIGPISKEDIIIGQYEGYTKELNIGASGEGQNGNSSGVSSTTPTFCALRCYVNTRRWAGVPFILKAGKGLNENKVEFRIQFKNSGYGETMFNGVKCPRNEFVMTMQPNETVYMKTNVKSPGFSAKPIQAELEIEYDDVLFMRESGTPSAIQDSYTRLLLDVCAGRQAHFAGVHELRRSWELLTPVLQQLEKNHVTPITYKVGSRGPADADTFVEQKSGYIRNEDYIYYDGAFARKTEGAEEIGQIQKVADQDLCDVGLYGLAVMGQNFALNMASHGFKVCVGNRSSSKVHDTVQRAKAEGNLPLVGSDHAAHFVAQLAKPRKVIILVQAGKPVDDTIATLTKFLEPGDIIVDGGNEWYPNSIRRAKALEPRGIHFIGMGISGGEEGARNGPSLMPGGPKEAYEHMAPILTACAAQVPKTGPCAGYLGPIGSGNYVKMVHNGIEYGDMQLIAEVYDILKNLCDMSNKEMAKLFESWNKGELSSYLIEITAKILAKKDNLTGKGEVLDYILDKTGMKGTGKWTIQEAAEMSVAAPTMAASLDTRCLSGRKEEREEASKLLAAPAEIEANKKQVIEGLRFALYAAKVCSYAQGLSLIKAASDEHHWDLNLAECARLWTGGCIIRAKLLDKIQEAFANNPNLPNLMVDTRFAADLNMRTRPWRRVVALALTAGIPCPALAGSLTYFDQYRRARLPANLTQAQRDFFGGHTYERIDAPGRFHTAWTEAHKDIGDASKRTAGEHYGQ